MVEEVIGSLEVALQQYENAQLQVTVQKFYQLIVQYETQTVSVMQHLNLAPSLMS